MQGVVARIRIVFDMIFDVGNDLESFIFVKEYNTILVNPHGSFL